MEGVKGAGVRWRKGQVQGYGGCEGCRDEMEGERQEQGILERSV